MRLQSDPLRNVVEVTSKILDAKGEFPPPPDVFGGQSLSELLDKGKILIKIDPKYLQAIGINNLFKLLNAFGNSYWDILLNDEVDSSFFTSDFPGSIELSDNSFILNRIVPLAPDIAVRIRLRLDSTRQKLDFNFPNFKWRKLSLNRSQIRAVNKIICQCAEEFLFFRDDHSWVKPFVKKYAHYWIKPVSKKKS